MQPHQPHHPHHHPDSQEDLQSLFRKIVSRWYFIVFSVSIALIAAFLVNRYTIPVYVVDTSILIKESKDNMTASGVIFEDELFQSSRNLVNESILLTSYSLVRSTLDELPLQVFYYKEGNVLTIEQYIYSPIRVRLDSSSRNIPYNLLIGLEVLGNNEFRLFTEQNDNYDAELRGKTYRFSEKIRLNGAVFTVSKVREPKNKITYFEFKNITKLTESYQKRINVEPLKRESSVLRVWIEGTAPRKEMDVLNKLIENYIQRGLTEKNRNATKTIEFIDHQLELIRDTLRQIETNLEDFRIRYADQNLDGQNSELYQQLISLDETKAALLLKDKYFTYLTNYIQSEDYSESVAIPSALGIEDPVLNGLIAEFIDVQIEIGLYKSEVENPISNQKRSLLLEIQEGILENIRNLRNANDIALMDVNQKELEISISLKALPSIQRELINIERMYSLSENLYLLFMEKKAEAGIAKSSTTSDVQLVDGARVKYPAIKPQKRKNLLIALFIGLVVPVVVIFILDFLDNKVRSKEDLERLTSIPLLGIIGHSRKRTNFVIDKSPRSAISESFRSIRSNIHFLSPDNEMKIFVITSSISGEGKTFCSINLSAVFCLSGKKTILIGADLRRPKIFQDFALTNNVGLSNYLAQTHKLEDVIQHTHIENLDIVSGGPIPPNPSELLMSDRMNKLIGELKKTYDYIVIDTPPIGLVTDARIIMNHADHILYIVRQGYTPRESIKGLQSEFKDHPIRNISLILNDMKLQTYKYGYYRYGYHQYGYGSNGYGYYEDESPNLVKRIKKLIIRN